MLGFLVLTGEDTTASPLAVVAAWAISTHSVRVELSTEPMHVDQYETGDALNTASWQIENVATGQVLTVIGATMYDATHVDLVTLEALPDHTVDIEIVASSSLMTPLLEPISGAVAATCPGVVQTMDPIDAVTVEQFRDRDLANPPFQIDRGLGYSGTVVIGADGDYETEAGNPLIKKLVMRRMGTPRGAHKHLPRYGIGLKEKEPLPSASDLIKLRADIESQALEEPDVESAIARLTLNPGGVLFVDLHVGTRSSTINIRMAAIGGRLVER